MSKVLLCCIIIFGNGSCRERESRIVQTAQGPVQGFKDPVEDIYVFYSIPYAQAPTGPNKFKAPLPPSPRSKTFQAVDKGIICPQLPPPASFIDIQNKTMQENCLIVNIYVPNTKRKNLPVLVFIHGGAFLIAYGDVLTPKKIVSSKKIIVLNFNYRLGAHGFLCLGTKDIPGNGGLKDQVALLRWVQQNIAYFGGNPYDVTISGFSAGSSSVGLLTLSEMATGLFKKAIQESGDVASSYVMQVNPIQNARNYAKLLNFDENNITALETFYKMLPLEVLQSGNTLDTPSFSVLVSPCVERDVGQEIFLKSSPDYLIKSGKFTKLPMLIGFTNMEGLMREASFDGFKDDLNDNFSSFLPAYLGFSNKEQKTKVATEIKHFYFGEELITNKSILGYIDFNTDSIFACPCLKTVKELVRAGNENVYLFYYSFVDEASTPPVIYTNVRGAQHAAETYAVLDGINGTYHDESHISNKLRNWKLLMRDIWFNFIKSGVPRSAGLPVWKPVSNDDLYYMALKESPEIGLSPRQYECSFWEKLYIKYYQQPSPPSATST